MRGRARITSRMKRLQRAQVRKGAHGIASIPLLGLGPDQVEQFAFGPCYFRELYDCARVILGIEVHEATALTNLSAHDRAEALPGQPGQVFIVVFRPVRSEEHTSELQSRENLVCRLLLEK